MGNRRESSVPWGWILLVVIVLTVWFTGGKDLVFGLLTQTPVQVTTESTPTPIYQPPPPDPNKNVPGGDYFNYIKTAVPTEVRERVSLPQLFSLDAVRLNQYFDQSTYVQANTEVVIVSAQRARAAQSYAALVWPTSWFTRLIGTDGQVLKGSELATITSADMFLVIGTTPGHVLANITDVSVNGDVITVTAEVEMVALYLGLNVSAETNAPQVENMTVATPDRLLDAWLLISDKLPTESELTNRGVRTAAKEAAWLLLHHDGPKLWSEFQQSVEQSNGGMSAYDLLAPFVEQAFCTKLDTYQQQLASEGKKLDLQSCDDNVTIHVVLKAKLPADAGGREGVEYLKMARSGAYVQLPVPNYQVVP